MLNDDEHSNPSRTEHIEPPAMEKHTFWLSLWQVPRLLLVLGVLGVWNGVFVYLILGEFTLLDVSAIMVFVGFLAVGLSLFFVFARGVVLRVDLSNEEMRLLTLLGWRSVRWAELRRVGKDYLNTGGGGLIVTLTMQNGRRVRLHSDTPHLSEIISYAKAARAAYRSKKASY